MPLRELKYPCNTICLSCGKRYGEHYDDDCPTVGSISKFIPVELMEFNKMAEQYNERN